MPAIDIAPLKSWVQVYTQHIVIGPLLKIYIFFLGKGCVFSFDPVGSYERETYRAGGSAASMLQPLLDNQVISTILTFFGSLYNNIIMAWRVCIPKSNLVVM